MAEAQNLPAEIKQSSTFAPTITVVGPDKQRFEVATNAAANRARSQIVASRLRSIVEAKIKKIETDQLDPTVKDLKQLVEAARVVEEIAAAAYDAKKGLGKSHTSAFEQMALGVVREATQGAVAGAMAAQGEDPLKARLSKIRNLGRSIKEAEVVIEEPKP